MTIRDFKPAEILNPFVKTYRIIESYDDLENRVLPNTSLAVTFRIKGQNFYNTESGKYNLPSAAVSGLRKSVRLINYSKCTLSLIILFRECGAAAFFREPLHELFENSIALDNIVKQSELSIIEERLSAASDHSQIIKIADQFLLGKLNGFKFDKLISAAITKIHSTQGFLRMDELANNLFISRDAFEKRFRKFVGTSPKQFSSIVRMSSIAQQKPHERMLDVALDAGYFDQAHFNKDFKNFTGQTPTDFFRSPSFW